MDQLGNTIIIEALVKQHRESLLRSGDHRRATIGPVRRPIRGRIGTALIRFGESIRGRSENLSSAEADHNLAYHQSA